MKYKTLKDYPHHVNRASITLVPSGVVSTKKEDEQYWFPLSPERGVTYGIPANVVENNDLWFEPVEEPIINKGDVYYFINAFCNVEKTDWKIDIIPDFCKSMLSANNIFPTRLFTEAEVQAHADRIKQLNKEFQESKK